MNRTERLLDLLTLLLQARRPVPFEEIRDAFAEDYALPAPEAARRKWERDKADLLALGLPLRYVAPGGDGDEDDDESAGGYVIDRERAYLPPLDLSPDETAVLYLAGLALVEDPAFPYRDPLAIALRKMELGADVAPGDAMALGRRVLIDFTARDPDPAEAERLRTLEDAIRRHKRVAFVYEARGSGAVEKRSVEPYGLFSRQGRWALVGRAREREAMRVFLVRRMRELAVNAQRPGSPDFEVPDDFRLEEHASVPAWRYDLGPAVAVVLDVREEFAWLAESELKVAGAPAEPGWRRFSVEATNADALVGWALAMGPKVRVREPAPLVEAVRAALAEMLAQAEAS